MAKDNVVKLSSTAATQATELTKNMNDKVKEGTLLTSVTSKVTDVSSKAWSNINSYLGQSGEGGGIASSLSNFNLFGRSGYDSMGGESAASQPGSNYTSYNNTESYSSGKKSNDWDNWEDSSWDSKKTNVAPKKETKKNDDWNNWEDAGWDNGSDSKKSNNKNSKDLMNFDDDDQWESIEPTSKNK